MVKAYLLPSELTCHKLLLSGRLGSIRYGMWAKMTDEDTTWPYFGESLDFRIAVSLEWESLHLVRSMRHSSRVDKKRNLRRQNAKHLEVLRDPTVSLKTL